MPAVPRDVDQSAIRVLVTGFGPFRNYEVNPSWLAVRPLHNVVIVDYESPTGDRNQLKRPIHITAIKVPVTYQAVLSTVPGMHASPAVLPPIHDEADVPVTPPENGYDFVFHVGVAPAGPLRVETLAHKTGYNAPDADGEYAPVISSQERGFTEGYEEFPDVLHTQIDSLGLIEHLKASGVDHVVASVDAGHYLCDFIMYCSLAEALRAAGHTKKTEGTGDRVKCTPTLFMHCPPVGQPLSTEQVTDAIKRTVQWICARLDL